MFCGTHSFPQSIPHIQIECEEYPGVFSGILLVPQNIVMDLNNVTIPRKQGLIFMQS